jgi:hypothetical protein
MPAKTPEHEPADWIVIVDDVWAKPRSTSEATTLTGALQIAESAMRSGDHPVVEIRIKRVFQPDKMQA